MAKKVNYDKLPDSAGSMLKNWKFGWRPKSVLKGGKKVIRWEWR